MNLSKKAKSISPSITLEITGKANELKAQGVNVMSFAAENQTLILLKI